MDDYRDDRETGRENAMDRESSLRLAHSLHAGDTNPVLLIGVGDTGKTSMLMSMCNYPTKYKDGIVSLSPGRDIFPEIFPGAELRNQNGRHFFYSALQRVAESQAWGQSASETYFVSLNAEFRPSAKTNGDQFHLAMLEIMGEKYDRENNSGERDPERTRPEFNFTDPVVEATLSMYEGPLSIIICAPSPRAAKDTLQNAHLAVHNFVRRYSELRGRFCEKDHFLYLMTYWDKVVGNKRGLLDINSAEFHDFLMSDPVNTSWTAIEELADRVASLSAMPYTAFSFSEKGIGSQKHEDEQGQVVFNELIWNWIYGNIKFKSNPKSDVRENVRPDLEQPATKFSAMETLALKILSFGDR